MVERVHRTIRTDLVARYIENPNNCNIEDSLSIVVNEYNNTIHSVTKFTPYEIFYGSDEELFKKVYNNIFNYYNNKNNTNFLYKIGEKCLFSNNILKTKKKINNHILLEKKKIHKNKSFLNYVQK